MARKEYRDEHFQTLQVCSPRDAGVRSVYALCRRRGMAVASADAGHVRELQRQGHRVRRQHLPHRRQRARILPHVQRLWAGERDCSPHRPVRRPRRWRRLEHGGILRAAAFPPGHAASSLERVRAHVEFASGGRVPFRAVADSAEGRSDGRRLCGERQPGCRNVGLRGCDSRRQGRSRRRRHPRPSCLHAVGQWRRRQRSSRVLLQGVRRRCVPSHET